MKFVVNLIIETQRTHSRDIVELLTRSFDIERERGREIEIKLHACKKVERLLTAVLEKAPAAGHLQKWTE